ncbi:MAG: Membrane protein involved in the export of O-antigen and teichoic acid [Sphingobacteriales bacterium]|nr:Membrane protein involved in the export of O-antigen and teichoic acid [Sphingobacteriales bacterium]
MSSIKRFAGQTAIYGLSTIVARLINFILTPFLTSSFPAKVYGIFTKMYSWGSITNAVLAFGMETTFFRYLNKHEENKQKVYNNAFITIATATGLFLLLSFLFLDDIAALIQKKNQIADKDYVKYVKYFIYILAADALAVIPFAKIRADGRPFRYGMIKFLNVIVAVSLTLFLVQLVPLIIKYQWFGANFFSGWYRDKWIGYVFISNLVASCVTLVLLLPEFKQLKLQFDGKLVKEMLTYSFPVLIANISFIINENIDKILLDQLLPANVSTQQVGIYAACAKIAIFLSIFVQAFRLGAEPFFFSHSKAKNSGNTYASIMNYFIIAVSLIFVAITANIEILKYFIPNKDPSQQAIYWSGLRVVPILLFGYVSLGIYMNLSIWYKLSDQTRYGLYISSIGAALTLILNFLFIPRFGYMASAWISLTAYASMMILSYLMGQKNYPIPYNIKKNVAYLIASLVIVYVSFVVFERNLIIGNILFLLFLAISVYIERAEFMKLLKPDITKN